MPAPVSPSSSLIPTLSSLSREGAVLPSARPMAGSGGSTRIAVLHERDLLADLEPHWVATIDAATD